MQRNATILACHVFVGLKRGAHKGYCAQILALVIQQMIHRGFQTHWLDWFVHQSMA